MKELVISSSVLILFVIMLRAILGGRIGFRVRYALWLVVAVRLALPFALPGSPFSIMNMAPRVQSFFAQTAEQSVQNLQNPAPETVEAGTGETGFGYVENAITENGLPEGEAGDIIMLMMRQGGAEIDLFKPQEERMPKGAALNPAGVRNLHGPLSIVWLAGAVCMAAYLLTVNLIVWTRLRKTRVAVNLTDHDEGGKALPVYCCKTLASPCLFGLCRPAVYLNDKALGDERDCYYAFAHERQHYRHKDHIWSFVRLICLVVYWFHPLVWAAAVLSARDCELACDEGVTARITEEECAQYGRVLLSQVPSKRSGLYLTVSTSMSGSAKQLKRRLLAITHRRKTPAWAALLMAVLLLLITGCTFTGADRNAAVDDGLEEGAGEPGTGSFGSDHSTEEGGADSAGAKGGTNGDMAGGADTDGSGEEALPDSELLSMLEESIRFDKDGEISFTIPQNDHAPEDWYIAINGKKPNNLGLTAEVSFVFGESVEGTFTCSVRGTFPWQGGETYRIEMQDILSDYTELSMAVALSSFSEDGGEVRTAITIDLLEHLQELSQQSSGEIPGYPSLLAYRMFSDDGHGWALTEDHQILYTYEGSEQFSYLGSLPFSATIKTADVPVSHSRQHPLQSAPDEDSDAAVSFLADNDAEISSCFLDGKTAYFAGVSATEGEALLIRMTIVSEPEEGDEEGQVLVSEHRTRIPLQEYYWCGNMYVSFADAQNGYLLVCSDPALGQMAKHLYQTTDGGDSFSFVADLSTVISGYPTGMAFCSDKIGYIGVSPRHQTDYLYGTSDGGKTWESVSVPVHENVNYADALTPVVFYAEGKPQMAIVLRNVAGQSDRYVLYENPTPTEFGTWQLIQVLPYEKVRSYCLLDRDRGCFINGSGVLYNWEYENY